MISKLSNVIKRKYICELGKILSEKDFWSFRNQNDTKKPDRPYGNHTFYGDFKHFIYLNDKSQAKQILTENKFFMKKCPNP
jgi:hypothetical protein